jgi:hypothetical protein
MITVWRKEALKRALDALQDVKDAERQVFGEKSCFYLLGKHGAGNIPYR